MNEYSALLRQLWFSSAECYAPVSFKRALGKVNVDYAGLTQHDVHEVLECLIDKIHEDTNSVQVSPL